MSLSEVAHQFDNKPDVSERVKQVLVAELLRQLEPNCLEEPASALAVPPHNLVVNHAARSTL